MPGHGRDNREAEADRPLGLFFDLGDTLVDLRGLGPAMVKELGRRFPVSETDLGTLVGKWVVGTAEATAKTQDHYVPGVEIAGGALRDALAARAVDLSLPEAVGLVRTAWAAYLPAARFHDDVTLDLLRALRLRVSRMGVVTDSDTTMVAPLLDRLGLRRLFDIVVLSDSVRAYKPDRRIFLAALAGGRPEESVFVSNSWVDLEGAAAIGMGVVWVRRGQRETGRHVPGAHVIGDFRGLPGLLDRLMWSRPASPQG